MRSLRKTGRQILRISERLENRRAGEQALRRIAKLRYRFQRSFFALCDISAAAAIIRACPTKSRFPAKPCI